MGNAKSILAAAVLFVSKPSVRILAESAAWNHLTAEYGGAGEEGSTGRASDSIEGNDD